MNVFLNSLRTDTSYTIDECLMLSLNLGDRHYPWGATFDRQWYGLPLPVTVYVLGTPTLLPGLIFQRVCMCVCVSEDNIHMG